MIKLANKIIEELELELLTGREAWRNLQEIRGDLSAAEYKEFSTAVADYLWAELNETEPEIDELILEESLHSIFDWDEDDYDRDENIMNNDFYFEEQVALFNPQANIKAGVHVLTTFRQRYKQCKADLAYRCYYAGAGWVKKKGKLAQRITRYEKKVRTTREKLHIYYSDLIEDIRSSINKRSDDR